MKTESRSVAIATRLVMLGLAVGSLAAVALLAVTLTGSRDLSLTRHVDPDAVTIEDPDGATLVLAAVRDVLPLVVILGVLWLALGILRTVREGDPFVAANVRRLRVVAGVLILGVPIVQLLSNGLADGIADRADVHAPGEPLELPGPAPVAGLGVLALAEVFAQGCRLREDVEGTI